MSAVRNWLMTLAALALSAPGGAAPALTPLAHSSLVTIDAALSAGTLILRVRRTRDSGPVPVSELEVARDGRNLPVSPRPDGSWAAVLGEPAGSTSEALDITVTHDGVREVLSARLPGATAANPAARAAGAATSLLKSHKLLAWWVLNIAVVLIGVLAVSRRMS